MTWIEESAGALLPVKTNVLWRRRGALRMRASGLAMILLASAGCAAVFGSRSRAYEKTMRQWYTGREDVYQELLAEFEAGDARSGDIDKDEVYALLKRYHGGGAGVVGSGCEFYVARVREQRKALEKRKDVYRRLQAFREPGRDYPKLGSTHDEILGDLASALTGQRQEIAATEQLVLKCTRETTSKEVALLAALPGRESLKELVEHRYQDYGRYFGDVRAWLERWDNRKNTTDDLVASEAVLARYPKLKTTFESCIQQVQDALLVVNYHRQKKPRATAEWGQYVESLMRLQDGRERYQESLRSLISKRRPVLERAVGLVATTLGGFEDSQHIGELAALTEVQRQILEQESRIRSGQMPKIYWPPEVDPILRDEIVAALQFATRSQGGSRGTWQALERRVARLRRDLEAAADELVRAAASNREDLRNKKASALEELKVLDAAEKDLAVNARFQKATIYALYQAEYLFVTRDSQGMGQDMPRASLYSEKKMKASRKRTDAARRLAEEGQLAGAAEKVPVPRALFLLHPDVETHHRIVIRAVRRANGSARHGWTIDRRIKAFEKALQLRELFTERLRELQDGSEDASLRLEQSGRTIRDMNVETRKDIEAEQRRELALDAVKRRLDELEDTVADPNAALPELPMSPQLGEDIRLNLQEGWDRLRRDSNPRGRRQLYNRLQVEVSGYRAGVRYNIVELRGEVEMVNGVSRQSRDGVLIELSPLLKGCIRKNEEMNNLHRSYLEFLRQL